MQPSSVMRKGVGNVRVPHQLTILSLIGLAAVAAACVLPEAPRADQRRGAVAVEVPSSVDDFHTLVQEPSRRRAQRPQFGNPLRDMNQRSSIQMLGAFRDAIGTNWKGTVELIYEDERVAYGAVVDRDGWIISKDSQIPRTGKLVCRFANGNESLAEAIEHNSALDLALLRVPDRNLEAIEWADGTLPQRGNWVATTDTRSIPVAVGVVSAGTMAVTPKKAVLGVLLGETDEDGGALVRHVLRGTGADLAGLRVGDRIRSINGHRLADRQAAMSLLESCRAGQSIQLAIVRGQEEIEAHAQMMDLANELHDETEMEVNGLVSARSSGFSSVFLHDTVLLPTQCGGPLVDLNGRVVGIN
ncbi:MAG: PDZ domain-containing protein, partial [Aureliella sp.]